MIARKRMLTGMGLAMFAAMLWALTLAASLLVPAGVRTPELLSGRYGVQVLLLMAVVMPRRGIAMVRTSRPSLQILRGLTMLVMPFAFTFASQRLGAAEAWAALWLGPCFGVLFSWMVLRERLSPSVAALTVLSTIGAVLAHQPERALPLWGIAAVLVAAASFGAFLTLTRALRDERPTTGLFWTALCVLLPSLLLVPFEPVVFTARSIVALAVMGTLWLLVLFCIDEALRRAPLAIVGPFLLTEVVWVRLLFHTPWPHAAINGALTLAICTGIAVWLVLRARPASLDAGASA